MDSVAEMNPMQWLEHTASFGIRKPKEVDMKKTAQQDPFNLQGPQQPQQIQQPKQTQQLQQPGMVDPKSLQRQQEMEAWERWRQDQNPQDFKFLLDSYQPFFNTMGRRYMQTSSLPPSTVKAEMIQNFHRALQTYNPTFNIQLSSHVGNHLKRTGRYLRTYQNIGKIPDPRAQQIGTFQTREQVLFESLGRPPSTAELADDLGISPKDIELLRQEIRKDILIDEPTSGVADFADISSQALQQMQFLHAELNPEQQNILEHTYGLYGRQPITNNNELGETLGLSPQKVRAIKRQIAKRYEKKYR